LLDLCDFDALCGCSFKAWPDRGRGTARTLHWSGGNSGVAKSDRTTINPIVVRTVSYRRRIRPD